MLQQSDVLRCPQLGPSCSCFPGTASQNRKPKKFVLVMGGGLRVDAYNFHAKVLRFPYGRVLQLGPTPKDFWWVEFLAHELGICGSSEFDRHFRRWLWRKARHSLCSLRKGQKAEQNRIRDHIRGVEGHLEYRTSPRPSERELGWRPTLWRHPLVSERLHDVYAILHEPDNCKVILRRRMSKALDMRTLQFASRLTAR